ncbi:Hypothetical predicted protein [Octopus vulgaris]|uniref:Uncharacterized protein n=1 Tax=Octopus vulgaris TaxID=6645 RepID=A0AA36F082_OCTVU|nr:Hypothetical predicted protein [Octopus vulgaris]
MSAQKRKRTEFTLKEKKEIINAAKNVIVGPLVSLVIADTSYRPLYCPTCFTLEEIAKEVMHNEEPVESEDDEVIVEEEYVSFADVQRAWSTIRKFMQQQSSGKPSVMQACDRLDNKMNEIR